MEPFGSVSLLCICCPHPSSCWPCSGHVLCSCAQQAVPLQGQTHAALWTRECPRWHLCVTSSLNSPQGSSLRDPASSLGEFVPEKSPCSTAQHVNVGHWLCQARQSSAWTRTVVFPSVPSTESFLFNFDLGQTEEATWKKLLLAPLHQAWVLRSKIIKNIWV